MPAGRLEHRKGTVYIGAKIGFRHLNRRHDISPRRQMKDSIGALACGFDRFAVGNVGGGDLEPPLFAVPLQIGLTAPGKVIDDPHPTTFGNQPINEVAADKATPARDDI
jgi:hypothetical protein